MLQIPRSTEEWKSIEEGFCQKWNFPGCCGALDGKHVVLNAPHDSGSYYYNYKNQHSIVLMALVDHDYCFIYFDIGCNGRISDGGVFRNSSLSHALENNFLPPNRVIVADNAFPLKTYLMKPYGGNNLSLKQKVFNYRLSRARRIVENAFGILVCKFRIFLKPLPYAPAKADKIVRTCVALHNWLRKTQGTIQSVTVDTENIETGNIIPGSWREFLATGLINIERSLQNRSSQQAHNVRDSYADYFVGEGSVPWQARMVH